MSIHYFGNKEERSPETLPYRIDWKLRMLDCLSSYIFINPQPLNFLRDIFKKSCFVILPQKCSSYFGFFDFKIEWIKITFKSYIIIQNILENAWLMCNLSKCKISIQLLLSMLLKRNPMTFQKFILSHFVFCIFKLMKS